MVQDIGQISHVAGSGRLIVKLNETVQEGQVLCDERGRGVAKVMEIIGSTSSPHASAAPMSDRLKKPEGIKVFITKRGSEPRGRSRKRA